MGPTPSLPYHRLDNPYSSAPGSLKPHIPVHMAITLSSSLEVSRPQTLTDLPAVTSLVTPSLYLLSLALIVSLFCPKHPGSSPFTQKQVCSFFPHQTMECMVLKGHVNTNLTSFSNINHKSQWTGLLTDARTLPHGTLLGLLCKSL